MEIPKCPECNEVHSPIASATVTVPAHETSRTLQTIKEVQKMVETKEVKRWKALVEYKEKGDILLLQQRLGHKNVRSTFAYLERSGPLIRLLQSQK